MTRRMRRSFSASSVASCTRYWNSSCVRTMSFLEPLSRPGPSVLSKLGVPSKCVLYFTSAMAALAGRVNEARASPARRRFSGRSERGKDGLRIMCRVSLPENRPGCRPWKQVSVFRALAGRRTGSCMKDIRHGAGCRWRTGLSRSVGMDTGRVGRNYGVVATPPGIQDFSWIPLID